MPAFLNVLWRSRWLILTIGALFAGAAFSSKEAISQVKSTINDLYWLIILIAVLLVIGKLIDLAKAYVERMPKNEK